MQNIVEATIPVIEQLKQRKGSMNLISEIFELHFKYNKGDLHYNHLHAHLLEAFNIDFGPLLSYIADNQSFINSDDKFIKDINLLKQKYGYLLKNAIQSMKSPFLLSFVESNVEPGHSEHKITFRRADEQSLDVMFTPGSMLPILALLTQTTTKAIHEGIYQLNEELIHMYIRETDNLTSVLKELLLQEVNQLELTK